MGIIDLFEKTVSRFPDKRAAADENTALTFSQLRALAYGIADSIGRSENENIGVFAERKVFTLAAFFGVIYAGGTYLPIDPSLPAEKLKKIISDAGVRRIISFSQKYSEKIVESGAEPLLLSENYKEDLDHVTEAHLLYLIYTSGSTGTPKGVAKSGTAMKSFVTAYTEEFGFDENTVIGNQTPFFFDASAKDIYLMATCGATLEIIPTGLFTFPVKLIEYIDSRRVNFISWVPSALCVVTALNTFSEVKPNYLRRVFFVGEVMPAKHLNKWMDALPEVEYVNLYGSSEICGICCYHRITRRFENDEAIPLGKNLSNCDVKLVDGGKVTNEAGISGEIYVASPALADGYYKNPERTAESFIPLDLGDGEKRYYRSGDIAKYNSDGILVFAARADNQIKHMGHRIELGEIENAASAIDGIEKCCCIYNSKRQRIILYYQPEADSDITDSDVRSILKEKLSDYMVPHRYMRSDALPLNANGKIDRVALTATLK